MNTLNKILIGISVILVIIFSISFGFNIYYLTKGAINVTNKYDNRQDQRQLQFQGQLSMNLFLSRGDPVEWKKIVVTPENVQATLKKMPPQQSYFAKVIDFKTDNGVWIIYPDFLNLVEIKK